MSERPLSGKNVLICGGTAGVGAAAARMFAAKGAQVMMLGRDRQRGERLAAEIGLETKNDSIFALSCDLASPESVRRAVREVRSRGRCLDVLILNAGLFLPRRELTPEGQERTFASLYLGQVLLTHLLMDKLDQAQQARIIAVTCPPASAKVNFDDLTLSAKYSTLKAQFQAKGALFMFALELSRQLHGSTITVNSLLPGMMIKTGLLKNMSPLFRLPVMLFGIPPEKAAEYEYMMATHPAFRNISGRFFAGNKEKPIVGQVGEAAECRRMWELTEKLLGVPAGQLARPEAATAAAER